MSFRKSPKEETTLRSICRAGACGVLVSLVVFGQAVPSTDRPSFEVATIKMTDPSFQGTVVAATLEGLQRRASR